MQFFGLCAQELLGEIFPLITVIGAIPTDALFAGEIREYGSSSWRSSLIHQTMNG